MIENCAERQVQAHSYNLFLWLRNKDLVAQIVGEPRQNVEYKSYY